MLSKKTTPTIKGDQIGSWKLGETLGLGSTGKVQLAYNKSTNKQAAIKIISKAVFRSQTNGASSNNNNTFITDSATPDSLPYGIEREIIIMKLLNHPNVLRLYDVWETNTNLYMVLEYAEKGELFNLLVERGPLPENEAIRFFRQIIIGISYCHALGIVHRDLKPENLLLDNKYNIKMADFGMAALETEDKLLETSCGSPHYAAPEIVSGIPYHGFASDVWSCGVILFALLTGRLPFDEEDGNIRNLLLKVQSGEFEMPGDDEISHEAQDLISKILNVDPDKRITARDILKHPLLQKYPSIKDSKSIRNLPREDTYLHPLTETNSTVDENILQNLVVLWHGRNPEEIRIKLNERGANAEKTLYALLHRFKMDAEQENLKNEHLKKRQSTASPKRNNSHVNRSPNKNSTTPQRRKNRASMISVASSHKRPMSYGKMPSGSSSSSIAAITPGSSAKSNSRTKRLSKISSYNNNNGSPTPTSRTKRMSKINTDRQSIIKNNKRASRSSKRISMLPNMKRGSVTTKLIATYAKLSEDDEWEYIEQETKRTSSDFATLIDEIFEHEKYEQIRKEKEELERKVKEAKKREEAERKRKEKEELKKQKEREEIQLKQKEHQQQMEEEIGNLKKELENLNTQETHGDYRSVSAPLRTEEDKTPQEFNTENMLRQRNFSLQTRPVSRLDPGLFFEKGEEIEEIEGKTSPVNIEDNSKDKLKTEKMILETIRRSKFLGSSFDINRELRTASSRIQNPTEPQNVFTSIKETKSEESLPKNAVATAPLRNHGSQVETRKISDIQVPQFTRKSRHFSESNKRLSVLSFYSSKQSYTNLAGIIKNDDDGSETQKEPAITPNSGGNSEFIFESVEEAENTATSSTDDKLFEVPESPEVVDQKKTLKLNLADRYNKKDSEETAKKSESKLPVLPPLDSSNAGLGIYHGSTDNKRVDNDIGVRKEKKITPRGESMDIDADLTDSLREKDIRRAPKPPTSRRETKDDNLKVPKQRQPEEPPKKDQPKQNVQNAKSFFRKLSGGVSPTEKSKKGSTTSGSTLNATVSANQLYQGLYNLLRGWTSYGIKNIQGNSETRVIIGKLSGDNILSLRSTAFEILVTSHGKCSRAQIRKKSGSSKAVKRLVGEVYNVLSKEGVLES